MGFVEIRIVCLIKLIIDKKIVLFGVFDFLLEGSFI